MIKYSTSSSKKTPKEKKKNKLKKIASKYIDNSDKGYAKRDSAIEHSQKNLHDEKIRVKHLKDKSSKIINRKKTDLSPKYDVTHLTNITSAFKKKKKK